MSSNYYKNTSNHAKGFTLLEVMVAISILAIAGIAINTALVRHVDSAIKLENRLIANWVASNAIAEARIAAQYEEPINTSGTEEMAGRVWRFEISESATTDVNLLKMEAQVFLENESDFIAKMTGYYSNLNNN